MEYRFDQYRAYRHEGWVYLIRDVAPGLCEYGVLGDDDVVAWHSCREGTQFDEIDALMGPS